MSNKLKKILTFLCIILSLILLMIMLKDPQQSYEDPVEKYKRELKTYPTL